MNRVQQLGGIIKEKSGKKLLVFTVVTTLIAAVIMFYVVLVLNRYSNLKLLDQYIHEVTSIVKNREEELEKRSKVFEEDALARGELGTFIYSEEEDLSVDERLRYICSTIDADSVSLVDEKGEVLNTTGIVLPAELFAEEVRNLKERTPVLCIYKSDTPEEEDAETKDAETNVGKTNEDEEKDAETDEGEAKDDETEDAAANAGKALVMIPAAQESGHSLVFEFSCESYMYQYNALSDWPNILERMLCELPAIAFVRTGGSDLIGYPLSEYSDEERAEITKEASQIFNQRRRFIRLGNDSSYNVVTFHKKHYAAVMMQYPEKDAEILLAMPFAGYINSGHFSAITLSLFIVFSLVLFVFYVLKLCGQMHGKEDEKDFRRRINAETRPGRLMLVFAVGVFTVMLILLESRAAIAYLGVTRRIALEYEIGWHNDQSEMSVDLYSEIYRTRAKAVAGLLEKNKNYRTADDLRFFSDILGAEYLMLFDRNGKETVSSNDYTGFCVSGPDANLNTQYNALLLGYSSVVVGPAEDAYTKEQQIGAAALMKKENGKPDGFVLAVFDAGALNDELEISSIENTVNTFAVANGNMAALVDDEEGVFLAHTDRSKIGLNVKNYLPEDTYGTEYEGYTQYDGKDVYVSGDTDGEKSVLFMFPDTLNQELDAFVIIAVVIMLVAIAFGYCPIACRLCVNALDELMEDSRNEEYLIFDQKSPLMIFVDGYAYFMTALSVVALYTAYTMKWMAFTFVFGGMWTRGIHLFSLWAVMFLVSMTLTVESALRSIVRDAQNRTSFRAGTVLKLVDSLLTYATFIVLLLGILYIFGVNTKALLASAGVVSIAVGMGAQTMIQDILAGLFMAIEDSIHLGDVVTIGESTGRVTDMGIRTTTITDENQNVMTINNSNISDVTNMSKKKTLCELELTLDRCVSMSETEKILENAIDEASDEVTELYGSVKLEGILNITDESFTVRLSFACDEVMREDVTKELKAFITLKVAEAMENAAENGD